MLIGFKHYKTFEWIFETNDSELSIIPNKDDTVWLKGHPYKVKKRDFGLMEEGDNLLYIYVKPCNNW